MTENKLKSILIPTVTLTVICIIISAALSFTNSVTKDKIAELEKQTKIETMSQIFNEKGTEFTETKQVEVDGKTGEYSVATKDGKTIGYVFTVSNGGYGGAVSAMVGINTDGSVKTVSIVSVADETPGLGQSAKDNKDFLSQFEGKNSEISEEKNKDIDALTGATVTTKAVIKDVNCAIKMYEKVKGEE